MKTKDLFNRIIAFILFLFSFFIFSALGMFPKTISASLPGWMINYNSNLIATGYNKNDRMQYETTNDVIKKGTYDELDFFTNADMYHNTVLNSKDQIYHFYYYEKNNNEEFLLRYNTNKNKFISSVSNDELVPGLTLKAGKRYYTYTSQGIHVTYSKSTSFTVTPSDSIYLKNNGETDFSVLAQLLQTQSTENINLEEFCLLLNETFKETIIGWYPESNIAIFKKITNENSFYIEKYNTKTLENTTYGPFEIKDNFYPITENMFLFFNNDENAIKYLNINTNKTLEILHSIDSEIMFFNYHINDNNELIFSFITDANELCVYNADKSKIYLKMVLSKLKKEDKLLALFVNNDSVFVCCNDKRMYHFDLEE